MFDLLCFLFQLQHYPPLVRAEGQRRQVLPVPVYGDGEGGWRDKLGATVNQLVEEGPWHVEGGLFHWLKEQARGMAFAGKLPWAPVLDL